MFYVYYNEKQGMAVSQTETAFGELVGAFHNITDALRFAHEYGMSKF